jgi:hypothetical protein
MPRVDPERGAPITARPSMNLSYAFFSSVSEQFCFWIGVQPSHPQPQVGALPLLRTLL